MKSDACTLFRKHLLMRFGSDLDSTSREELRKAIAEVIAKIKEPGLQKNVIDAQQVEFALSSLTRVTNDLSQVKVIDVISAWEHPRFHYDTVRKIWYEVSAQRTKFGSADDRADMLRTRYEMILQRLQRLPAFQNTGANAAAAGEDGEATPISTIESLMGQVGKKCIFGQLSQLTEGVYSLEDPHAHIPLNLTSPELMLSSGLFTEGCMVLVEGETRDDGVFHASTLISPPAEPRMKTLTACPPLDWLGSNLAAHANTPEKQLKIDLLKSSSHADDMIVILSDVHLDKPKVLQKIATMLEGLKEHVPPAFVFMGNFTSAPFANQPGEMQKLKGYFDGLCDVLLKYPALCRESHFVFIPGPRDLPACLGSSLPQSALPAVFTARLRDRLTHVTFATNPCRVSWVNKEICLYREELVHKLRRNCIRPPSELETSDVSQHLVKTVIDQAHLAPLPADKRPIYWNYDHALRLYPLPDLLVLADCVDQYEWPYEGVKAINPGTFAHDFSFVVYFPAKDNVEFSRC